MCFHFHQRPQEAIAIASDHSTKNFVLEFLCNGGIAHQESAIEKRGIRLHVRFIEFLEVVRMPDLMPDLELQIPQRVEDAFNRLFVNSVLEEKQKVDIRLRMNSAAAVSAEQNELCCVAKAPDRAVDEDREQELGTAGHAAFVTRRSRCHQEIAALIVS